jgi:sugar phosphate isomerase/epimerase
MNLLSPALAHARRPASLAARRYTELPCRSGGTGRRARLKIEWPNGLVGSIPTSGTTLSNAMTLPLDRRAFLSGALALPLAAAAAGEAGARSAAPRRGSRIKLSCNLYSFNDPLTTGAMTLEQVIDYCAELGFDAVDPTGYYFKGYPAPAADAEVYRIKHLAFRAGLGISGTGVRNNFVLSDETARAAEVAHVMRWIDVASKLGAPVLRVFSGLDVPAGHTAHDAREWVVECLTSVVQRGAERGVMIVLQNHHDFVKTAEDVLMLRRLVPSDWFGLNVDIGSLRMGDPYAEIAKLAPYAYTWQLKERLYRRNEEEKTDVSAIVRIIRDAGYRGYVPIETLGPGDAREKVRRFVDEVRAAMA